MSINLKLRYIVIVLGQSFRNFWKFLKDKTELSGILKIGNLGKQNSLENI
jgi:hypothetical protein